MWVFPIAGQRRTVRESPLSSVAAVRPVRITQSPARITQSAEERLANLEAHVDRAHVDRVYSDCLRLVPHYDPPSVAASLASSGLFDTYMAYERSAEQMWFAADPLARITITRRIARIAWPDGLKEIDTSARAIAQIGDLIEMSGLDAWTAYGLVAFEAGRVSDL